MAKRFTETSKWDLFWFRKLPPKLKCSWFYILDRCDHAGIWDLDIESLSHFVNETVTKEELFSSLNKHIILIDEDKLFIPDFIDFQYGTLNPENRVHQSVLNLLAKEGLSKDLINSFQGAKDKDKDKDKEKDRDKEKDKEKGKKKRTSKNEEILNNPDLLIKCEEIQGYWNSKSKLSKVLTLNPERIVNIGERLKNEHFVISWRIAIDKILESKFLLGEKTDWKATFDWFIKEDLNFIKILEGNYAGSDSEPVSKAQKTINTLKSQAERVKAGEL